MNRVALVIGLALVGVGAVLLLLYKQRFEAEATGGPRVPVLVVKDKLALGAVIEEGSLTTRLLPMAYVEERQVRATDTRAVLGARTSSELHAGETLRWTDLASASTYQRNLSGLVRIGMRALTLRSEVGEIASLLRPGDRVDLVLTTKSKTREQRSSVIAQAVLVLAVGTDLGGPASSASTERRSRAVTVALTIEQAQLVQHAMGLGSVGVVLRNPDDLAIVNIDEALRQIAVATEELAQDNPVGTGGMEALGYDQVAKQLEALAASGADAAARLGTTKPSTDQPAGGGSPREKAKREP